MTARRFLHLCIGISVGILLATWVVAALGLVVINALAGFHLP